MIDDAAVRAALEAVLGGTYQGLTVTSSDEICDPQGSPHIRTRLIRISERQVSNALTVAEGMFEVLVHVPVNDGPRAAEVIAGAAKLLFRLDTLLSGLVRPDEAVMLPARPGIGGRGEGDDTWTVVPLQVDWSVEQFG